jgi:hypothetical protein
MSIVLTSLTQTIIIDRGFTSNNKGNLFETLYLNKFKLKET